MILLLYLFLMGIFAGLIGSVIGIGGVIIIVPFLAIALKIHIHLAIGTSIICVLATSLSASIRFFKKNIINPGLAMALEIPTTIGSITGSITVAFLKNNVLFIIFGCFTLISGVFTYIKNRWPSKFGPRLEQVAPKQSIFDSEYYDQGSGKLVKYHVRKVVYGSAISTLAGFFSGLLGVGGGIIKVPAMHTIMDVPLKVATATSSYMIGITAVVSSVIYFFNGFINPVITIPAVAGVLIGGVSGSFAAGKIKTKYLVIIILAVFILIGILMFMRGFNILNY